MMYKDKYGAAKAIPAVLLVVGIIIGFAAGWIVKPTPAPEAPELEIVTETVTVTETVEVRPRPPPSIKVGFAASLTGRFDVYGREGVDALTMWADWVNEKGGIYVAEFGTRIPVEIVYYDDASDKDTAIKVVEKLIVEDGVHFVMPSYSSSLTLAEAPVTEKHKRLMFAWAAASDKIWEQGFKYVVGTITPSSLYNVEALKYIAANHPDLKRIAILHKDDPFTTSIADGTEKLAKEMGFEIVFRDKYPPDVVDVSPLLLKLQASNPDIIFVESHLKDGMLVAKQMAELRVWAPVVLFGSSPAAVPWYDLGPAIAEFTSGSSQWEKDVVFKPEDFPNWYGPKWTSPEWFKMWVERFGYEPDFRAANMFHSALVLQAAIERAGTITNVDRLREVIAELDIQTFVARFKVDPDTLKQVGRGNVIIQWMNGKKEIVAPVEAATATWVIPMPRWEEKS